MKAKTHLSQNKSRGGFTLVEMLVVIGMIGALAGISFPVYKSIQKKVEGQKLAMTMNTFEMAIENFDTEYNYLPFVAGAPLRGGDVWLKTSAHISSLTTIMVGAEDTVNFKKIKFFETSEAKGSAGNYKDGLHESAGVVTYYTPWGSVITQMLLDTDCNDTMSYIYNVDDIETKKNMWYADQGPDGQWYGYGGIVNDDLTNFDDLRAQ
jgi:prepilin-type N-terminal cleavage/methylation domain-containing protein